MIGLKMFSFIHFPILFNAFTMPVSTPRMMFSPGSSIVFAGLAIPKAFLNPSIIGVKM